MPEGCFRKSTASVVIKALESAPADEAEKDGMGGILADDEPAEDPDTLIDGI